MINFLLSGLKLRAKSRPASRAEPRSPPRSSRAPRCLIPSGWVRPSPMPVVSGRGCPGAFPRGPGDPAGHQLRRAGAARRRRGAQESLREPVGARYADSGAILLTHRVAEAVQGRAARLSTGGHAPRRPESRNGHSRARPQVTGIRGEYRRLSHVTLADRGSAASCSPREASPPRGCVDGTPEFRRAHDISPCANGLSYTEQPRGYRLQWRRQRGIVAKKHSRLLYDVPDDKDRF